MDNAVRTRQRMLALVLPFTAALYVAAEGLDPKGRRSGSRTPCTHVSSWCPTPATTPNHSSRRSQRAPF